MVRERYQDSTSWFILDSVGMTSTHESPTVVWFRDDLRIRDNAAVRWAAERGPVIGLFIDEDPGRPPGGAARWWRERSLGLLYHDLASHGVPLLRRSGDPVAVVAEVAAQVGADAVTWNRRYHQPLCEIDAEIKTQLRDQGLHAHSHPGFLLTEPWEVTSGAGTAYKVYTPFSKAAFPLAVGYAEQVGDPFPKGLTGPDTTDPLDKPEVIDPFWATELASHCSPGEQAALDRLEKFLDGLREHGGYAQGRDEMARAVTSGLSPYLRFGEISIHRVWSEVAAAADAGDIEAEDAQVFLKELLWRDFAWHRLYALPQMDTDNVRAQFDRFGWAWDEKEITRLVDGRHPLSPTSADEFHVALAAWRAGLTGIPLVDAGMRELWATGSMHNRSRMVVASFLTKNLQIHWRHGEEWFWETLVDADPASNAFNWQWAAGSGDDASPYFRIFNPETQASKFDPDQTYIRRWVPEYGTPDYPEPIVDLKESRRDALEAYEAIK